VLEIIGGAKTPAEIARQRRIKPVAVALLTSVISSVSRAELGHFGDYLGCQIPNVLTLMSRCC
jgi:hypothetical protein